MLNVDDYSNCYMRVDVPGQTGETVDDAVYNRSRKVEEILNCEIVEELVHFGAWENRLIPAQRIQKNALSGDNEFECAYMIHDDMPYIITDGSPI